MVLTLYKRRHYDDPKPSPVQCDDDGNPLLPRTTYNMDGNEIEPEGGGGGERVTESGTILTIVDVDYGLFMLFIG